MRISRSTNITTTDKGEAIAHKQISFSNIHHNIKRPVKDNTPDLEFDAFNKLTNDRIPIEKYDDNVFKYGDIDRLEPKIRETSRKDPLKAAEYAEKTLRLQGERYGFDKYLVNEYVMNLNGDAKRAANQTAWSEAETLYGEKRWEKMSKVEKEEYASTFITKEKTSIQKIKQYLNATKVLESFDKRYKRGYFDKSYDLNDIFEAKVHKKSDIKKYENVDEKYRKCLPQADAFISDDRIVSWTKDMLYSSDSYEKFKNCKTIQELAKAIYEEKPTVNLVSFQDAQDGAPNVQRFFNFGDTSGNLRTTGPFQVPEYVLKHYASKYPEYCSYENGKFEIKKMEKFGDEVLSGVKLSEDYGAIQISTKVPFHSDNIAMPSVENRGAYMAFFTPGGRLLSDNTETTICPIPNVYDPERELDGQQMSYRNGETELFVELSKKEEMK